jgi:AcrR family transcriptional regulator
MPRGVAIPEVRQQLFAAVERIVAADGPTALTGRAVTREAGVATGLLHAHFADFDEFLAQYAIDRAFVVSAGSAALPGRAGTGDVAATLTDAVLEVPAEAMAGLTRLLVVRPQLADRVRAVLGEQGAGLDAVHAAVAAYLAAEQRLRRLPEATDTEALALAVVGVLHHLALTAGAGPELHRRVRRTVAAVIRQQAAGPGSGDDRGRPAARHPASGDGEAVRQAGDRAVGGDVHPVAGDAQPADRDRP